MKNLIVSYLTLRKMIGFLGIGLPIALAIGALIIGSCSEIQPSISDYYHTKMRDLFVGVLCVVGSFLHAYKGPEKKDNIAGNLAGLFAFGVAFFPTPYDDARACEIYASNPTWVGVIHFTCATLFFLILAYFSLVLFTKTDDKRSMTKQKKKRNHVYRICGYAMLSCIALIALYKGVLKIAFPPLEKMNPIFWLETSALWAFGFSWLTKGEFLLADEENA